VKPAQPILELVPLDEPKATRPDINVLSEIEIVPMGRTVVDNTVSPATIDRFLKEATQQYEEGHVDLPLWNRALAQAGNDKATATDMYLRARATALRLLDRERRLRRTDSASGMNTVTPNANAPDANARAAPGKILRKRNAMIAAVALVPLGFCAWLLSAHLGTSSTSNAAVARSAPATMPPPAVAKAPEPEGKVDAVSDKVASHGATPAFLDKMAKLNDAGNWNVLVLYAVEWTRLEPANAAAWNQLRDGYVNLRQYRDALDAATKAVQLAPEDSRMWRNLGQVNMDLNAPGEALKAFDQALVVNPGDAMARCLRMSVVQPSAVQKDAKAPVKQPAAFDGACRGLVEPVAAR
jgi:tetratricopeptide (TPR) repeat protein